MLRATAKIQLQRMTAYAVAPTLCDDEIEALLDLSRRAAADGRGIDDSGWIETYDLNWAAYEGWNWKAAKCSDQFATAISADGISMHAEQVFDHCEKMADRYRRRIAQSGAVNTNIAPAGVFNSVIALS